MKTISKRFLKGALAMLLAVIMLFGSCISGFAAVVDTAETSGNHSGGYVYFIKPSSWTNAAFIVGHDSWFQTYKMTKLSGNLYYLNLRTAANGDWNGWNGWGFVDSNTTTNGGTKVWNKYNTYTHYTGLHTSYSLNNGSTYVIAGGSSNGAAISPSYKSSGYSSLNSTTQTVYSYSTTAGGSTYTADAAAASTLSVKTQQLSGNGSIGTATTTSKTASATSAYRNAALGSAVTVTAAAADGYTFKGWFSSDTSTTALSTATSYTYNAGTGDTSVYAKFEKAPKYSVTYNANGGTSAPAASTNLAAGSSHTVSSTVPTYTGYNFKGWNTVANGSGSTYTAGQTITVNSDITLYAQWAKVHTITYNANGGTGAPANGSVEDGSNYTISSTVPTKANYNFTGWKDQNGATYAAGATISAVSSDMTLTAQWELAGVCSPAMAGLELEIDETGTVNATTNQFCEDAPNSTFTYSIVDGGDCITLNGNVVTPKKPGTAHIMATCSCGETVTCAVTVKEPVLDINPEEVALLIGQSMTEAFVASANVGNPTVTFTSKDTGIATVTNGKATAVAEGNVDIEASLKFNDYYTATICAKVSVSTPTITANPASVALEFGEGATDSVTTTTVTLDPNTEDGNGTGDNITVTTDNSSVATATVSGTTLTINATGVGSTTVKATFHGTTVEIPVTVTKYDPWAYVYFTDDMGWGNVIIYTWNGTNTVVTDYNTWMIKIGKDAAGKDIFAYRFDKNAIPDNVIFKRYAGDNWNYKSQDGKLTDAAQQGYFINQNNSWSVDQWSSVNIKYPTVSVDDVVVAVGDSVQVTAESNGLIHKWSTVEPTIATVTGDTATATVRGVAPGDTDITVRAFIDTTDSTLASVYSDNVDAYPFISTEATATVTVGSVDYEISVNATEGGTASIAVNGGDLGTSATIAHGTEYTLTADANDGYRFVGFFDGDTVASEISPYTTTAKGAVSYTAKFIKHSTITVDGEVVDSRDAGVSVTVPITVSTGQYLASATILPAIPFVIADNAITFTMPAENVSIVPSFDDYAYVEFADQTGLDITGLKTGYKAGELIEITVKASSDQVTISTLDAPGLEVVNNDGIYTITGTLTAGETVTVTTAVEAKFSANATQVAIGNYGTGVTVFGSVTLSVNGEDKALGSYFDNGTEVTYKATPTDNYVFDGFYSNADCSELLTHNAEYTTTLSADTTVYALFARRQWMDFDSGTNSYVNELTYDVNERVYTLTTTLANDSSADAISYKAWFQVTNDKNSWTADPSYHHFDTSPFTVSHNANGFDATISWNDGGDSWLLTTAGTSAVGSTIKFILTPTGNTAIDFSAQVGEVGDIVFLSSGRLDLPGSYNSAVFNATTKFTHEGAPELSEIEVKNDGTELREKYSKLNLTNPQTVTFETEITGTAAGNYEVESYVVYHIDTETYTIVAPNTLGNNKYNGSVYVDGPCYIVPIYFLTEEYANANGLVEIDIYFDATAILDKNWGPFVACYTWGSNGAEYSGGWSGQMMIPSEDGSSFYTMITVPSADAENPPSVPNGVTFNNYMQSTVPGSNAGAFGVSSTQYQCYDYREPITLYEAGYDVITFVAKESTDGYHGDRANGVTANTVTSTTTDIFNKFDFDYLYSRDGVTPMDLNGDKITNPVDITTSKADYYIVTKGDITYDPNGTQYEGDVYYDADWSVDWYVFDSNGAYLTHVMSDALYQKTSATAEVKTPSLLLEKLGLTREQAAGKTVAISYEHENNAGHQISYDGQWYGNMLTDYDHANVVVGLVTGENEFTIDVEAPINVAGYGDGYIVDPDSNEKVAELDVIMDYGEIDLIASANAGYRFVGWYTYVNGEYKRNSPATNFHTYINKDTTYYAMFEEIGDGQIVINHLVYNNPNDPVIPSHGGVAEMLVEVLDSQGNIVQSGSIPSTSISTAVFTPDTTQTYTIRISTTPLMNGTFFAWYGDSETVDGTKTYEEILVEPGMIGSTTKVEATFEYSYDPQGPKTINIYSDVTRVSNKADLFYRYQNRFGEWRTYTVRDLELTDDECMGFKGNEGNKYCPAYLTLYTFGDANGNEVETVYCTEEDLQVKLAQGLQVLDSYNKIQDYAPSAEVTEAFDQNIVWEVTEAKLSTTNAIIVLTATQQNLTYTVNYTYGDTVGAVEDVPYNTLMDITADAEYEGKKFSYWEEYDEETDSWVFLTYNMRYSYRIVEDKQIKAVYGGTVADPWVPSINSVTYTREYGDDGDYIYTDYLLAYNSRDGKKLNEVKGQDGEPSEFGLLLVRNSDYYIDENNKNDVAYPDSADLEANLKNVVLGKKSAAFTVGSDKYNCYYYNLTDLELTNFNRCDAFITYDNNKVVSSSHYYREYAFTAVAYIVVDDVVYLSTPENVNFYELGMADYK